MNTQQVRHVRPLVEGATLASLLIDYLNSCRSHRGRLSDQTIVVVWELHDLDQLDAFLRELPRIASETDLT